MSEQPTVVTVRGTAEAFHPAERAVVTVQVGFEGPERAPVVASTTQGTGALVAGVRLRHDPERGPVTWFATDRIRVWSQRPWSQDGAQLPVVHHAATTTRVKFRDVDALAQWVEAAARHHGVRIDGLEWTLTERTRAGLVDDVRARAVENPRAKARTYAAALGIESLRCVALADEGMLGDQSGQARPGGGGPVAARAMASAGGGEPEGLSFTPEDIAVSTVVDARFVAG